MRKIKPPPGAHDVVVLNPDDAPLYGFKALKRAKTRREAERLMIVRGIQLELFVGYLRSHWPNHWAVKATRDLGLISPELLEDISEEIVLDSYDACALAAYQNQLWKEGRE